MPNFYVRWYDDYGCGRTSKVYFVDSLHDRFLVVKEETGDFYWINTSNCELLKEK